MGWLVALGAVVTLAGLGGIVWVIIQAMKVRREGLKDEALRTRLGKLIPVNLASFFLSFLGLLLVLAGVFLG